jgi:Tfp pilus assembly protein PilN
MRLLPNFTIPSAVAAQFVPANRFFLRFVPLAPGLPALPQAELALEGLAPFPPAQLFWGCCIAPDRASALVYAAHRRRFTPEETAAWERADLAVPDLLPLLGAAPAGPVILVLVGTTGLSGAAWATGAVWPAAVHTRDCGAAPTEELRRAFATELAAKAKLPEAPVKFLAGTPRARREGDNLIFEVADAAGAVLATTPLAHADQDALDVRDRASLDKRRRDRRRGELVWQLFLAGGAAAALALLLDLGALAFGLADRAQQAHRAAQAAVVGKLETAHGLTSRIDELTHRRLRFFEMLATINAPRPSSISFTRTSTSGRNALEIEAQTGSADDVGAYETALRALAGLEKVEVRDLRARDGVTTFALTIAFKADAATGNGGAH